MQGFCLHFEQVALSGVTIGAAALSHPQSGATGQAAKDIGTVNARAQNVDAAPSVNFLFIFIFPPLWFCFQNKNAQFYVKIMRFIQSVFITIKGYLKC